ncbi:MAG: hypothetical protein IJD21_09195 [Oscillospiraceae bacterium]|nr:hypothetical protein [Oscillospiraceae bacterium]
MGSLDVFMNTAASVFGKKKKEQSPQDKAAKDRQECKDIASVLGKVRYKDYSDRIAPEKMEHYKELGASLTTLIGNSSVIRLPAEDINSQLKAIAEYLQDALYNGSARTVEHTLRALDYGIREARKDLPEKDMEKMERILKERVECLGAYRSVVEISSKADKLDEVIRVQMSKRRKDAEELKSACKELQRKIKERPDLVQQLEEYGLSSNLLRGEAKDLDTERVRVIQLGENVEQLQALIATNRAALQQDLSTMNTLIIQLSQKNVLLDDETLNALQEQQERLKSELIRQDEQIREMEKLNHGFTLAIRELGSSPEAVNDVIRHEKEYGELLARIEAEEEGRKLGQQLLRQAENEQKQTLSN